MRCFFLLISTKLRLSYTKVLNMNIEESWKFWPVDGTRCKVRSSQFWQFILWEPWVSVPKDTQQLLNCLNKNVKLTVALEEKSGECQHQEDSSSRDHECVYKISQQSISCWGISVWTKVVVTDREPCCYHVLKWSKSKQQNHGWINPLVSLFSQAPRNQPVLQSWIEWLISWLTWD